MTDAPIPNRPPIVWGQYIDHSIGFRQTADDEPMAIVGDRSPPTMTAR